MGFTALAAVFACLLLFATPLAVEAQQAGQAVHTVGVLAPQRLDQQAGYPAFLERRRVSRVSAARTGRWEAQIHPINSSARACIAGGIFRPIAFAVFRLMISSNRVGCSTGRSAGLAPL